MTSERKPIAAVTVSYATPHETNAKPLLAMAWRVFAETFAHLYEPGPFAAFCERVYSSDGPMGQDLRHPDVDWWVASVDEAPVGYAKLTPLRAPAPAPRPGALELQQIYVQSTWQGKGVAECLMAWALVRARERGAPELYLTVFDHNIRAKRFYARHGFAEVGRCTFVLGNRVDDDRIWRRTL